MQWNKTSGRCRIKVQIEKYIIIETNVIFAYPLPCLAQFGVGVALVHVVLIVLVDSTLEGVQL